jgi:glycine C-acetyltransferase
VGAPVNELLHEQAAAELDELREAGTFKRFNVLESPQGPVVRMAGRGEVIVLSSNNYLGLADHPEVVRAGIEALERYGAGTASVRFICGTFAPHLELERKLAAFSGTEAALTYVSCWNANEALIPTLTDEATVILSDRLNHASIIDAIRLSKPERKILYEHSDMAELREGLRSCRPEQRKLIITDGVFSMEGDLARLPDILELARSCGAAVIVDDSHGVGVLGATGRGVTEHFGVVGEVDAITGTLGKALGGAAGGYVASTEAVCEMLAQRSRPQLFSNALPPTVAASALAALRVLDSRPELLDRLRRNVRHFRTGLLEGGFRPLEGESAIIPVIVGETARAIELSERLLDHGVFVTGFGYPVVPEGTARVRVQMSAAHEPEHLERALEAFAEVGRRAGLVTETELRSP